MANNQQSMNGLASLSDSDFLENGILNCEGVIATDITTTNLNANYGISAGESVAVGKDVAIGNSLICPNLYTTKLVSNTLECQTIKTDKINLSNNLQLYDESTVGYIKSTPSFVSKPLLLKNENLTVTSIKLPIGVYMLNYTFDIALSAVSTPALHSITHALSSDNVSADILFKQHYGTIVFNNTQTYVTMNDTVFYQVTKYNATVYLLAVHNSVTAGVSNIVLQNVKLSALRIA